MIRSTPWLAVLCATALGSAAACAKYAFPKPTPAAPATWQTASVAEGKRLFRAVCAGCHGDDGRARTAAAEALFPKPRDLTSGVYRFRSTTDDLLPLRSDILRTLRLGLAGTAMPAWGSQLDDRQLMSVVLFLETLASRFQEDDPPEPDDVLVDLSTLKAPRPTPQMLARGREVFDEMKCWECHGRTGRGDGPSVPTLENTDKTPAHVFDFTYGRYKGGTSPVAVYRTFTTGLDGTPMPSYADTLSKDEDRWALVYYVLSLSRPRGLWFYLTNRATWEEPALD